MITHYEGIRCHENKGDLWNLHHMKSNTVNWAGSFNLTGLVLATLLYAAHAQPLPTPTLRLEQGSNGIQLVVNSISTTGAVFVYSGSSLSNAMANPSLLWQTNAPSGGALLPAASSPGTQAFFFGDYWPDRSVDEFGDPEDYSEETVPDKLLFTSDLPTNLGTGQVFTVDFIVATPSGESMDISGTATILVVRAADGVAHPDAIVTPPSSQMTNGYMRAVIAVTSTTPLTGYTLALSIAPGLKGSPSPGVSSTFLKAAFGLGSAPLTPPQKAYYTQQLEQRRLDNADSGATWSYPAAGGGYQVSGTFGEWRGKNNQHVHCGLDLAAPVGTTVRASRGGVVSQVKLLTDSDGNDAGMGWYVVIDHGTGWFSRYLHLDGGSIAVTKGQAVARGATLATRLYSGANWGPHLHFEVRLGANESQWEVPQPETGKDPLQVSGIFAVPAGVAPPRLEEFGLTRQHPATTAFVKSSPSTAASGPVYLFGKWVDVEPKSSGGDYRLSLKSMQFQPEGAASPIEIRPQDETAVDQLRLPGTGQQKGFARYSATHAKNPDRKNYFRYWWLWDTSSYASDRKGPRTITLTGEDYSGTTSNYTLTFGPKIKGSSIVPGPLGGQQYQFTNVAYLGTNLLADPSLPDTKFSQPDQYLLQIINSTNGLPVGNVVWSPALDGGYSRVFTVHTNEQVYTFILPGSFSASGLKLRVSSRLVTNIAHEVCFCSAANMVFIPPGTFVMGSPASEALRDSYETQHTVTLTKGFCMGKYAVTQGEYLALMGSNPSYFAPAHGYSQDLYRPVEQVSWNDATAYCAQLTAQEQLAGRLPAGWVYRLPTESEREYACRAGTNTAFHYGSALRSGMANFYGYYEYDASVGYIYNGSGIYLGRTTAVGSYTPNAWGLHDMHGNVWEWCRDWYGTYPTGSVIDPQGAPSGSSRVVRGGCWCYDGGFCRSAFRGAYPSLWYADIGFRVVLAPGQP